MSVRCGIITTVLWIVTGAACASEWINIPEPPLPKPGPRTSIVHKVQNPEERLGELPTPPVTSFIYNNYRPGQINLGESRLTQLLNDINFSFDLGERSEIQVESIKIIGNADMIPIKDHRAIWDALPSDIRPLSPDAVTNKTIAEGRAGFIRDLLLNDLGYRLPTGIYLSGIDHLPISPKNRGIEVKMSYAPNGGIKKLEELPWSIQENR